MSASKNASPRAGLVPLLWLMATLLAMWLLWSGHYTLAFVEGEIHPHWLLVWLSLASVVGVALLCRRMGIVDTESIPLQNTFRAVTYVPWLFWQMVLANFEVIRRILAPRRSDQPCTLVLETSQKGDLGRVTYANSITLTPGTLTVGIDDETVTVHALTPGSAEGLADGVMDRRVTRFEGLSEETNPS